MSWINRKKKVLIAPKNIANQGYLIKEGMLRMGLDATLLNYYPDKFYSRNTLSVDRDMLIADPLKRFKFIRDLIESYDIFYFHGGESLLPFSDLYLPPMWDIPLIRSLGKRVIFHFHGSEVRIPEIHVSNNPYSHYRKMTSEQIDYESDSKRDLIHLAQLYGDDIFVSTRDLLNYVGGALHMPLLLKEEVYNKRFFSKNYSLQQPLKVVHIPSNRNTKSSDAIMHKMQILVQEGVISYSEYANLKNSDVLNLLEGADIVIDGMSIGAYGVTSLEASMSSCLPISYLSGDLAVVNDSPVVNASLNNIIDVIRRLYHDKELLRQYMFNSYNWTKNAHNPDKILKLLTERLYGCGKARVNMIHYPSWPTLKSSISKYSRYVSELSINARCAEKLTFSSFVKTKLRLYIRGKGRLYYYLLKLLRHLRRK